MIFLQILRGCLRETTSYLVYADSTEFAAMYILGEVPAEAGHYLACVNEMVQDLDIFTSCT